MELVHNGHAPAAIVLDAPDAILLLGLIVARRAFRGCMVAVDAATEAGARVALRIAADAASA
jgi:predicted aconitase with swiveling domain